MKYKFLEHTADVKFQAFGTSLEKAFESAALAMQETILKGKKTKIKPAITKSISVFGKDKEALLYAFLEEFLFLLDSEGFMFSKIKKLKIKNDKLEAEVVGDLARDYKISNDVKAVTYNDMFIDEGKGKVRVQVVLDV